MWVDWNVVGGERRNEKKEDNIHSFLMTTYNPSYIPSTVDLGSDE